MLFSIKNNTKDNICSNALDAVTRSYNGANSCIFKTLNGELYETAEEIGRLRSVKFQLEGEVEELQKKVDHYDIVLFEKSNTNKLPTNGKIKPWITVGVLMLIAFSEFAYGC